MKKYLSIAVFCVLGFISLNSCGTGGVDPTPDWTVDVNANKENITLNTLFPASGRNNSFFADSYLPRAFEKATGYKVIYNQTTESGADVEVNAKLNTKEEIDMLKISETLFNNYVINGYFTDLTDGLKKYAPNLFTLSEITDEQWEACTYNGKIYAIPEVGHTTMIGDALVWNMEHLAKVGISKMPSTISEFDEAMEKLQAEFGDVEKYPNTAANYHAFALNQNRSEGNTIAATFDMPSWWFINDNNEVETMLNAKETENYLTYMHTLYERNMLAKGWSGTSESTCINNMVSGYASCIALPYWNMTTLRESAIDAYKGIDGTFQSKNEEEKTNKVYGVAETKYGVAPSDALFQWNKFLLGDGTHGTNVQKTGRARDSHGIAYYITVPVSCASRAAYTLDWINYKQSEELTILNVAGEEGVHWEKTTSDDKDAIKLNTLEGEPEEYVKILDKFDEDINGMSQYQTAVNPSVARKWWPVAEKGFNAWDVLCFDDSIMILNPIATHPVFKEFSKVDLNARNYVVTQLQNIINQGIEKLETAKKNYASRYWKDAVKNEVNTWWQSKDRS